MTDARALVANASSSHSGSDSKWTAQARASRAIRLASRIGAVEPGVARRSSSASSLRMATI
jgi:hypothetical protein